MAITKERLDELIKEGATVYSLDKQVKYPIPIFLKDGENVVVNDNELVNSVRVIDKIENLYETQKEAKWHLKYHATRIEELNLPYWTDIVRHKDDDVYKIASFRTKNGNTYNLLFKKGALSLWNVRESRVIWVYLATEENYTKLCDLCVKLFKGEQDVTND